ncbi:MAG TPA: ferritin-like domain-containing protein [Steroidobacteraceae bacterium]|nr:ferritin-like domain-containing protein [Steroidobacteraceae bacterium]
MAIATPQNTPANGNAQLPALSSAAELRARAMQSLDDGAVTQSYAADREKVIALLNQALATELVCVLRYRHHYFVSEGLPAEAIKKEFLEHAEEEQRHADQLAERIIQLGGDPNFDPKGLAERSHAEYGNGKSLLEYLRDDLISERVAIEFYTEAIQYIGSNDPTTRRVLESILSAEEEHAEEIASMLASVYHRKE